MVYIKYNISNIDIYNILKVADVFVQIFMVQLVHNGLFHVRLQIGQINDHAGDWIDWSTNAHLDGVIVTVPIGIVTFTVHFLVGFVAQQRTIIQM